MTKLANNRRVASTRRALLLATTALVMLDLSSARAQVPAKELPTGGTVAAGSANISQSGSTMTVTQGSDKAVINWNTFNIGSQASVTFVQPSASSAILNRVLSGTASQIYGKLSSNGQVFLINRAGVMFGPGAQVNVGSLVASSMNIKDNDFLSGKLAFSRDDSTGTVTNQGTITAAPGGFVGLFGPTVVNHGLIETRLGSIMMAGGEMLVMSMGSNGNIALAVDPALVRVLVENKGVLSAADGRVYLTAKAATLLAQGVINNSGIIEANSLGSNGGTVVLSASSSITQGGTINVSGAGAGGSVALSASDITLVGGTVDASGGTKGGAIVVGDWSAKNVGVDSSSRLDASAHAQGDGGRIDVIAQTNRFAGTAVARGAQGGKGGLVETSGHNLSVSGAHVDAGSTGGASGTWLLDPWDLTIDAAAAASIQNSLATNNVTIQTTANSASGPGTTNPAGNGDIIVDSTLAWSANILTLDAYRNVQVNANMTVSGSGGLKVVYGDTTGSGTGSNSGTLRTQGASVKMGSGTSLDINNQNYTLIHDLAGLQAVGTNGNYALASDIVLSGTFSDALIRRNFSGTFEGLGNAVSGMTIVANAPNVGLFSLINYSGVVRNLSVSNANISGSGENWGLLAGVNYGSILNSRVSGTINAGNKNNIGGMVGTNFGTVKASFANVSLSGRSGLGGLVGVNQFFGGIRAVVADSSASGSINGLDAVGGLVGLNFGSITSSSSDASVSGSNQVGGLVGRNGNATSTLIGGTASGTVSGQTNVGGLIGANAGQITDGSASGAVTGTDTAVGGLAGENTGTITNSSANGTVTGGRLHTGGLAGANTGDIRSSTASGSVSGRTNVGGLIGANTGQITGGSASGAVSGTDTAVGGLAGYNTGTITNSNANGRVTGGRLYAGGLVGWNFGDIRSSTASGAVTGDAAVGGLVGSNVGSANRGSIVSSAATGSVAGTSNVGGLAGVNSGVIQSSNAGGNVVGSNYMGGLVGNNSRGTITASNATGNVTAGSTGSVVGGLVGWNNGGTVTGGNATGTVAAGTTTASIALGVPTTTPPYLGTLIGREDGVSSSGSSSSGSGSGSSGSSSSGSGTILNVTTSSLSSDSRGSSGTSGSSGPGTTTFKGLPSSGNSSSGSSSGSSSRKQDVINSSSGGTSGTSSSGSSGATASSGGTGVNPVTIAITMAGRGQGSGSGVAVRASVGGSSSFTFVLPKEAFDTAATDGSGEAVRATLPTGQSLPSWLSFSPATRTFIATDAPEHALPLTVLVHITSTAAAPTTLRVEITR